MFVQAGISTKWANNSQHFILEYFDIIHNSPSHIYHSALPLYPSTSWLHECYSTELLQEVKVVKGLPVEWGTYSHAVSFSFVPQVLAYWNNKIAIGLQSHHHNIIILDATMGNQISVLSSHTNWVRSLIFSPDGAFLVSGGDDKTIKLWDVQTGGVVMTFYGHTSSVTSVSISPDNATIVSGSWDGIICIWGIQSGECYQIIKSHNHKVTTVCFSPAHPQHFVSASEDGTVRHWDLHGHQIKPTHGGHYIIFSPNGTYSVSCEGTVVTVQISASGKLMAKFHSPAADFNYCCFSPNEQFVAGAAGGTIYIWDIASPDPHLVRTIVHSGFINSLTFSSSDIFSSSLVSASNDKTVKFWQSGTNWSTDPVITSPTPGSAPIESVSVQADDGIAISSDSAGVVKKWDLSTGLCKASFVSPAKGKRDIQLIDGRLIIVWYDWKIGAPGKVHIWDVEKEEIIWMLGQSWSRALDLKISGDGSKVFLLNHQSIQAWNISTGEYIGEVKFKGQQPQGLTVYGSRVWLSYLAPITYAYSDSDPLGWDFGISGCSPIPLSNTPPDRPHFNLVDGAAQNCVGSSWIEDTATKQPVFYLPKRFTENSKVSCWDKQYLVIGHNSGEVLILDFSHIYPK